MGATIRKAGSQPNLLPVLEAIKDIQDQVKLNLDKLVVIQQVEFNQDADALLKSRPSKEG